MMQQTIYKLGMLSLLTVLVLSMGILYFKKDSNAERLSHRLNMLEQKIVHSTPGATRNASNDASNELAVLQEKIITLQNQLNQINSHLDDTNSRQKNETVAASEAKIGDDNKAPLQEPEVVAVIKNTGYLYEDDWKKLEQPLTSMDKDENKQFWQSMTSAIENNEIELYSE
jgi:hypothetical protein